MPPSILRTAHGLGADALLRAEVPPLDEGTPPNAADTEAGLAVRAARGRPFQRGNSAAKGKKPALALLGVKLDAADPRYRRAMRLADTYRKRRVRELSVQSGGDLDAGTCAMLANSALAMAASRVLYAIGAETLDPAILKQAASLADSSRQQELTAVAMAERTAASRPRASARDALTARIEAHKANRGRGTP